MVILPGHVRSTPMGYFLSYNNISYLKRSHFLKNYDYENERGLKWKYGLNRKNLKKVNFTVFTHVTYGGYEVKLWRSIAIEMGHPNRYFWRYLLTLFHMGFFLYVNTLTD